MKTTICDIEQAVKSWEIKTGLDAERYPYSTGGQLLQTLNVLKTLYQTILMELK